MTTAGAALSVREADDGCELDRHFPAGLSRGSRDPTKRLSEAVDVVAWMAEQAHQFADSDKELAMAETLASAFEYMVEYLRHVSLGRCESWDALARAASGPPDLTLAQMDFLRLAARKSNKMLTAMPGGRHRAL